MDRIKFMIGSDCEDELVPHREVIRTSFIVNWLIVATEKLIYLVVKQMLQWLLSPPLPSLSIYPVLTPWLRSIDSPTCITCVLHLWEPTPGLPKVRVVITFKFLRFQLERDWDACWPKKRWQLQANPGECRWVGWRCLSVLLSAPRCSCNRDPGLTLGPQVVRGPRLYCPLSAAQTACHPCASASPGGLQPFAFSLHVMSSYFSRWHIHRVRWWLLFYLPLPLPIVSSEDRTVLRVTCPWKKLYQAAICFKTKSWKK